jgi:hypothetical protein
LKEQKKEVDSAAFLMTNFATEGLTLAVSGKK